MFDHNVPVFKCPEVQYINRLIIEIYKINLIYELKTVACMYSILPKSHARFLNEEIRSSDPQNDDNTHNIWRT